MTTLGAEVLSADGGVRFAVWTPRARAVAVRLVGGAGDVPLRRGDDDVWSAVVPGARPGARYLYVLDGERARPDPRSRFQPEGVHGPSEVVDPSRYAWRHPRPPTPSSLADTVIYEVHVGTFTPAGTFAAAAAALPALVELGVTAVELMPVAAFSGARNWGYDGVHLYAPCAAYGTPDELRAFVDTAHGLGLRVVMDVVYNHLGPEGNYLSEYGPYFTPAHRTPWGDAIDFGRPQVRAWAIDNAHAWLDEYRVDALRLDAIHAIVDESPTHVLAELTARARPATLIAETDMNDVRVFDAWGFDACWSDDFHHALHACLTGERGGYYAAFGPAETLALAIERGWIRGPHPERSAELPATRLVIAAQTHDQVGNRARGERLSHLVEPTAARLAAVAALAAAPGVPLLFMGEEFAASAPFQYFTSHGDPALGRAVSEGRRREFADFGWRGEVPDPQDERTFLRSKLDASERAREPHAGMLRLYRDLLALRRARRGLGARAKERCRARVVEGAIHVARGEDTLVVLNVGARATRVGPGWQPLLHAEDPRYGGGTRPPDDVVPPRAAAIFARR